MKRILWDVLVDSNTYRVFSTGLEPGIVLEISERLNCGDAKWWKPLRLQLWEGERGERRKEKKKPMADFMSTTIVPVVSPRARTILAPLLVGQVEYLPFETPVGPYYGLHVRYVDCLDKSRIEAKYFSDGRIMRVIKYAFHWEKLEGIHIFRLPELGLSRLFVADEFKQLVEENGLTGLLFYPVPLVEEQ